MNTKRNTKKIFLMVLITVFALVIIAGAYFLYKYFCPTDKELFAQSHIYTINSIKNTENEMYEKTTDITLSANGDFSGKKLLDKLTTLSVSLKDKKVLDDKEEHSVLLSFLGEEILSSNLIENDDLEVLSIPQLSDKALGADSYEDALSLLLGSQNAEDIDVFENVDEKRLGKYIKKYLKKIYDNIPKDAFESDYVDNVKIIELNADLNRTLYDTLIEIKNDFELRAFLYEEYSLVCDNINKKYPYAGEIIKIPSAEEYYRNYEKNIDDFIKTIENSTITITTKLDNKRRIIEENILVKTGEKLKSSLFFSDEKTHITSYEDDKVMFEIDSDNEKNGSTVSKKTKISVDINDYTKEKSEGQKILIFNINSLLDKNISKDIVLPDKIEDIRTMSEEEKKEITQNASAKFSELIATVTLKLIP